MNLATYFTRRNLLIASIGLLVVVLVVALVKQASNPARYTASQPFATNLSFARQVGDHTVDYFSGSAFVSYDLDTFKSTPLTPVYSLPQTIGRVLWSRQGALMEATGYSENDQLYAGLVRQSLDPNQTYWWLVNFKTGAVSLVGDVSTGAHVYSAVWTGDEQYTYNQSAEGRTALTTVRADLAGKLTKLPDTPAQSTLVSGSGEYLAYSQLGSANLSQLVHMSLPSGATKTAVKNVSQILSSNDTGSTLLIAKPEQQLKNDNDAALQADVPRGTLTRYDATTGKVAKLAGDFVGNAAWYGDQWFASGTTQDKRLGYFNDGSQVKTVEMISSDTKEDAPHFTAIGRTAKGLLANDTQDNLAYVSKTAVKSLPALSDYTQLQNGIESDTYYLTYVASSRLYAVYVTSNPYATSQQTVMARLQELGYDPYQVPLRWYATADVDNGFRLTPDEQPAEAPDTIVNPNSSDEYYDVGD